MPSARSICNEVRMAVLFSVGLNAESDSSGSSSHALNCAVVSLSPSKTRVATGGCAGAWRPDGCGGNGCLAGHATYDSFAVVVALNGPRSLLIVGTPLKRAR